MKRIAIIGANEFQNPLILKAKEMGFETHVFAWEAGDVGERTADFFHPISIVEIDQIFKVCQDLDVDAVASIGSDLAVLTVNSIARRLGLPCNDEETDLVSTNKYMMRNAFDAAGLPTPRFTRIKGGESVSDLDGFVYPLIVKPTDRSGSRGIFKINDPAELNNAITAACAQSFSHTAIVEEFIDGPEYSCECISWNGNHKVLAFTKKYTTGAPHFIETGHREPSDIPESMQPALEQEVYKALDALNIRWGAAHVEFRLSREGQLRLIEICARMGGDCIGSDLVYISTGYDFLRMVIDVSQGKEPDFRSYKEPENAEVRFAFTNQEAQLLIQEAKDHPERVWRLSEMATESTGVTDSSTRLGFCIFHDKG